jgi:hypothetical protein
MSEDRRTSTNLHGCISHHLLFQSLHSIRNENEEEEEQAPNTANHLPPDQEVPHGPETFPADSEERPANIDALIWEG